MILTPTKNTIIFKGFPLRSGCYWLSIPFLFFIISASFSSVVAQAEVPIIRISSLAPDWHGKEMCGGGAGYDPSRIVAPSLSYSGNNVQEPSYDFSWQQRINDGAWVSIESASKYSYVPSFDPPLIKQANAGSAIDRYSWKVVVKDMANGQQLIESDEYTVYVGSDMLLSYKVYPSKAKPASASVNVTVLGGLSNKNFEWENVSQKDALPDGQKHAEDLAELPQGIYQVTVRDGGCADVSQIINTSTTKSN